MSNTCGNEDWVEASGPARGQGRHGDHEQQAEAEQSIAPLDLRDEALPSGVAEARAEAVVMASPEGMITACNEAVPGLFGYTAEELAGQPLTMLFPEEEAHFVGSRLLPTLRETGLYSGEVRRRDHVGKPLILDLLASLLRNGERQPTAIVLSFRSQREDGAVAGRTARDQVRRAAEKVRRLEQELRRSRMRLESVLSRMTESLTMFDRDWRYTFVNEPAARMLGRTASELIGKHLLEVFPEAKHSSFLKALHRVAATGTPLHFDEFYPEPLNRWLDCHCYPHADGISVYFRDISERQQYVDAVLESDSRARIGMQVAKVALADIDYNTGIYYLSKEAACLFGLGSLPLAVSRAFIHGACHPEDRLEFQRRVESCLKAGSDGWFAMDVRILLPDGQVRWLRARQQVYFKGQGSERHPDRAMLAAIDVTAEHMASALLRDSESRFQTLAESLPELVWEADEKGKKLYCNQRYLDYIGITAAEGLEHHWHLLVHPEERETSRALWEQSLQTGEPYQTKYRMRGADAEYRHFLVRAFPQRDENGVIHRWLGSSTEIHGH